MGNVDYRRIFIIAGACSLCLSYLGIWLRMINDPVERTGADFIHFYSAGRIAQIHGSQQVYDTVLQHDVEEELVGFELAENQFLPYNHMPFLIPLLQLTMNSNYVSSFYRWVALMTMMYLPGLVIIGRLFKNAGLEKGSIYTFIVGGLLFLPFFVSLMNGQDTSVLFLGTVLWAYGLISGKYPVAGTGLSLTLIRPHISLLLALPMLFYDRRVFRGFIVGSGILGVISFFILGVQGTQEFINMLLLSAGGEWYGIKPEAMFNLIGLLTRAFPWLAIEKIRLIGWTVYGLTTVGLSILWWKQNWKTYPVGLTVVLALFVAPHLYFHDLTILLIPLSELILFSRRASDLSASTLTMTPLALSLLFLVSNISPFLQYTVPYLVMAVLAVYAYRHAFEKRTTRPHQS